MLFCSGILNKPQYLTNSLICLENSYQNLPVFFMQNEITSTYIISIKIEITWKHTFTLVTRTRSQSISQQNPAAVYAKSFQLLSFKGSLSNYES